MHISAAWQHHPPMAEQLTDGATSVPVCRCALCLAIHEYARHNKHFHLKSHNEHVHLKNANTITTSPQQTPLPMYVWSFVCLLIVARPQLTSHNAHNASPTVPTDCAHYAHSGTITLSPYQQCGGYGGECGMYGNGPCVEGPWKGYRCMSGSDCAKVNVSETKPSLQQCICSSDIHLMHY